VLVDKAQLLRELRERDAQDLEALVRRQRDIQEGAIHEENRAEHAKDTRATEQSYLARGLAERVDQQRQLSQRLATVEPTRFEPTQAIAVGALVVGRDEETGEIQSWWLVAGAGGVTLSQDERIIRTITPGSPLGRAMIGLQVGDSATYATPRGERSLEILEIH